MRIIRFIFFRISVLLFVLFVYMFFSSSVEAASLKFDKGTVNISVGSTFTLDAQVDAGSDQITSTDMWITYDPALLEAQSASAAAFFPAVTNNISAGRVYIAGLVTDQGSYKTGAGTVASVTFKGLQNGTATISYDCRTDVSNTSKVIKNAVDPTNVIVCTQNGTSIITIGTGGVLTPTVVAPTTVYTPQPQPSTLPKTGFMDELPKLLIAGSFFVMAGVMMRIFLLL